MSASKVANRYLARIGYVKQPQDQAGTKTLVTPKSQKNLQPDSEEKIDDGDAPDTARWPQDKPESGTKQVPVRLPTRHREDRQREIDRYVMNVPDAEPNSRERTKTKTPVRTPGTPGEEYGHPTKYDYNMPTRRHNPVGGLKRIFPKQRQKKQLGPAKIYSERRYRRIRNRIKPGLKLRYRKLKPRMMFQRDKRYRREYPERYERRGGGYSSNAERTREWRSKNKPDSTSDNAKRKDRQKNRDTQRKRKREKSRKANAYEWHVPAYMPRGDDLYPIDIVDFNSEAREVLFLDSEKDGHAPLSMGLHEFMRQVVPEREEDADEMLDILEFNFGEDLYEGVEDEDFEGHEAGDTFYRDQTYPKDLPQNWQQKQDKGVPRSDQTRERPGDKAPRTWVGPQTRRPGVEDTRKEQEPRGEPHSNPDFSDRGFPQPAVEQQSGSAKVIPDVNRSTGDLSYRNKEKPTPEKRKVAAIRKMADTIPMIRRRCAPRVIRKAKSYKVAEAGFEPKRIVWTFKVGNWEVKLRALPGAKEKGRRVLGMNVRLRCSCPFWRWQGPEHWGRQYGYQYGALEGTASFPVVKDPRFRHAACKHAVAVFDYIRAHNLKIPALTQTKLGSASRYLADILTECEVETLHNKPDALRVAARHLGKDK